MKILDKGYYILEDPSIILWHKKKSSIRNLDELIFRQMNSINNRIIFWPSELVLIYFLKTFIKHPIQAFRYKVFKNWLKIWLNRIYLNLKFSIKLRRSVNRRVIVENKKLKLYKIRSEEDLRNNSLSYLQCILDEIFKPN